MYYYIVDPPESIPSAKITPRLQELVTPMGIAGEIAVANPARSAEELTYMGLDKGFTTLVAVGDDELINTVATILISESPEKIALGVIPFGAGPIIQNLVGCANGDLRKATEIIQKRHLDLVDAVQIGSKRFTVTEAFIVANREVAMHVEVDQTYKMELRAEIVHISNDLVVSFQGRPTSSWLARFGLAPTPRRDISQVHGKQIRIVAHEPLPVTVADVVVAKTPTTFTRLPGALKLVTTRAILPARGLQDVTASPPDSPRDAGESLSNHELTNK